MELPIQLIVKVQQFEDKRIEAKASWNIKELKGKLSEIYPTSTEEQKLIYSGKLLNDTVVLKDVLREYEGQEGSPHTVHLVFTPKSGRNPAKFESHRQSSPSTASPEMSTSELRQRQNAAPATNPSQEAPQQQQQQPNVMNILSNHMNFVANSTPGDANSILAQQYAMQTWMQQAYAQYMNQYMSLLSSPEALYQMNQQQQTQQPQNFAFLPPQMPFTPPSTAAPEAPQNTNNEPQAAQVQAAPQPQPAAERRFPNIIQDEQENRDWLDILYSMSRLMILLCLVYFYSSPVRCLVVILIGITIYLYHIYKQNENRLNNNNSTRVNLNNVNRPAAPAPAAEQEQPAVDGEPTPENTERSETDGAATENESEPLVATPEPQVPLMTIVRTFVLSFFSSIIPEAPAL